jgi:hypothetical protein
MRAFLSYQTTDKAVAGEVKKILEGLNIESFLAHEDIEVSAEWRLAIIQELMACDIFVAILSKNYYSSIWCKQESGMAAYRGIAVVPLSIDGSIPEGFIAHIQSTKIDPKAVKLSDLLPGLVKHSPKLVIDELIKIISGSWDFRGAERNFELLLPYLSKATRKQIVELLNASTKNKQICHASLCATKYLPPLYQSHGKLMQDELRAELADVLKQYEKNRTAARCS